jgi:hypothetical protein
MGNSRPSPTPPASHSQDGEVSLRGDRRGDESPSVAPYTVTATPYTCSSGEALEDGWFFARVKKTPTCWLWRGKTKGFGYGSGPRGEYAHRWAYRRFVGPIPEGLFVLHTCDTPLCVNYKHLFLGTQQDNLDDAKAKGRIKRGTDHYRAKLTEDNVRLIRRAYAGGQAPWSLASLYGVAAVTIRRIGRRESWAWLP